MQPGRSGTYAPKLDSPFSITTRYCIALLLSAKEPSLLQSTAQCTNGNIDARLACDRHGPWLGRMVKLPMAPTCASKHPAVVFKHTNQLANLHVTSIGKGPSAA